MALTLLLVLSHAMVPVRAQNGGFAAPALDTAMAEAVFSAGIGFMLPRILAPEPAAQLALWGMHGLTALDPQVATEQQGTQLRLTIGNRLLAEHAAPGPDDLAGWGTAITSFAAIAWENSPAIRLAGTQGVIQSFFDELFNHMDPYSRYSPPAEAAADQARRDGTAGIGITLAAIHQAMLVGAVQAGSPAARQGVRVGQQILAVDGHDVAGQDAATVSGWIAGAPDSQIMLVLRSGHLPARRLLLRRVVLVPETVFAGRQGDTLVIRVTAFARGTAAHLANAVAFGLTALPRAKIPPSGLVLDLRGNRGGLLHEAVLAAGIFLDDGVIVTTAGRDPAASAVYRVAADPPASADLAGGLPMVVLIDGRSASAAEILAAALQDHRRGVVVGSASLGKGLVQTITTLPDGGALYVTWSRVLAPDGWPLQGLGVLPQICTGLGEAPLEAQLHSLDQGTLALAPALTRHDHARAPLAVAQILELRDACPAAEATDADLRVAQWLLDNAGAYRAARRAPPNPLDLGAPDAHVPPPAGNGPPQ